ncbi:MAG: UDP-N-acetylmuramoyl-L-alanine--D-glutamate ligase [Solirubrobacteraceae bacterium]|nr:UDP-N-acetylmuramoyl-L-alanine--D-glutamate ligase [Solirubrobacteraceae bacterium]
MRVSELEGRRVGLWGAGREAASVARALTRPAGLVVATDAPADAAARAAFPGAEFADGPGAWRALAGCDVVVRSPGISRYRDDVRALAAAGPVLTTATNLWFAEHGDELVIGVTGTKGKSTTAALVHRLVTAAGAHAELAGNIGRPLLDVLRPATAPDAWVVELSSYQLADLDRSPRVAVVVNLYREHLDWHGSEARYVADKLNLLAHGPRVAVLNGRDERLLARAPADVPRVLFGVPGGYDAPGDGTVVRDGAVVADLRATSLLGEHNALNAAAALTAAEAAGLRPADPQAALAGFVPLPHRLQAVARDGGVTFVDDSISTTPESGVAALRALAGGPVALIVGGQDRGQDYAPLAAAVAEHGAVRAAIGLPATGERALAAIGAAAPTRMAGDLDEAVAAARAALDGAGTVLLSPAAPSYGWFRDFEERGERFLAAALATGARPVGEAGGVPQRR